MARSTSQENPDGVASRDACNEHSARHSDHDVRSTINTSTTAHEQNRQSPDFRTTIDALLGRFLLSLNAKEVVSTRGYRTFALQPGAYAKALESLFESDHEVWGYVQDELRHDLVNGKLLIVKMPSSIHEFVNQMISDSIKKQLATIEETSNEPTKRLIQSISSIGSRDIKFFNVDGHRQPDQQFAIEYCYYPGVVIELAYSQPFEELRCKADDFIVDSYGNVQLVIALETGNKKACKISAWRPDFTRSENENTVAMKTIIEQDTIQDENGKVKSGSITFQLQDFGTNLAITYPDADLTKEIVLHYNDLAGYLVKAEKWENIQRPPPPSNLKKRKQSPLPKEELRSEDEEKFRRLESMSFTRSEAADSDYLDSEAAFEYREEGKRGARNRRN